MRSRLVYLLGAGCVLGAMVGLTACGGGGGSSAKFDLKIGNIIPLTGDLSPFGPSGRKAASVAVSEIKKAIAADKLDETVTVQNEDEQTDPSASVSAARKLADAGSPCMSGAYASADTIPVSRSVTTREQIIQISPASTSAQITGLKDDGYLNRTAPPDSLQGPALASAMDTDLGGASGKTVNVAARNDAYGTGLAGYFISAWQKKGGKIGQKVIYDPKQPSYDSEAQKIASGNPDAWVIIDFPETYDKVGPALVRTGGWDPKKTFITDGLASTSLIQSAGAAATVGMRGTAPGTPQKGVAAQAFGSLYDNSAPKSVKRNTFDAQNFDSVVLCYLAAVAAGKADGPAMKDELKNVSGPPGTKYTFQQLPQAVKDLKDGKDIDYEGASGAINLDDNGDPTAGVYDELKFTPTALQRKQLTTVRQVSVSK